MGRRKGIERTPWGQRIDAVLDGRPYTWICERTGINKRTISDIVHRSCPGADKAVEIAQALGVSVEWLMTGEHPTWVRRHDCADDAEEVASTAAPGAEEEVAAPAGKPGINLASWALGAACGAAGILLILSLITLAERVIARG